MDYVITATGGFGNFLWELPEDIKEMFEQVSGQPDGAECVGGIQGDLSGIIKVLLYSLAGALVYPPAAPEQMENIKRHIGMMMTEGQRIIERHRP